MRWTLCLILTLLLPGCTPPQTSTAPRAASPLPSAKCSTTNGLPDPACTPGAWYSSTREEICTPGWAKAHRPKNLSRLKRQQIRLYGFYAGISSSNYIEDHLVALEVGGVGDDPDNLWPQTLAASKEKDQVENAARRAVCVTRTLTLIDAQEGMARNWRSLGRRLAVTH